MELIFLGTGAGMPSSRRNVSSIALRFSEFRNTFWLFDCGEATQHQIMKSPLKLSKLEMIFLTHLHGDHLFGLPGLLTSRANQGVKAPLRIFGPEGIKSFIDSAMTASGSRLEYELTVTELSVEFWPEEGGPLFEDERYQIFCAKLDHRIECYGYRIEEKEKPGKLDDKKLAQAGVPSGPIYGRLKQGENVELPDGTLLYGKSFVDRPVPGRIVAIMGDTRISVNAVKLARDADVLVHEATFAKELQQLAFDYHHSTSTDAALVALNAGAKALVITHLSSRYQDESEGLLLAETRDVFPNCYMAEDLWTYPVQQRIT